MKIVRHDNATDFLAHAEDWLSSSEAENNVALGVARRLAGEQTRKDPTCYWATVQDAGVVVGCAIRTPPHLVSLTQLPPQAISLLCEDIRAFYGELPGVGGPRDVACQFAEVWAGLVGTTWTVRTRLLIHELTSVQFPEDTPNGALRHVRDSEFDLIRTWAAGFVYDTGIQESPEDCAKRLKGSPNVYVWDDQGPRCMVAATRDTPNGSCINAVYTPPAYRGLGYASAAVATVSDDILRRGKRFCCLYTDAANPTSNSIYRKIGYRPVREDVDIAFFR